jgi:hypothetical protein
MSDNGSQFSSVDMLMAFINDLNSSWKDKGLAITTYMFHEPQSGKSRLDSHFEYTAQVYEALVHNMVLYSKYYCGHFNDST